jgi:ankyrin repeat protein
METVNLPVLRSLSTLVAVCALATGQPRAEAPFPTAAELATFSVEYQNGPISLHVSGNGLVEYNGSGAVIVEGKHQLRIKPAEVQQLVASFRRAKFFTLRDHYSSGTENSGTTTISMEAGSMKKTVVADWTQAPSALEELAEDLLKYSHSDQWVVGNADTVKGLLAETPDAARRREVLSNVLPRAAAFGDTTLVQELLTHKPDLERRAVGDATPLMHAAERGLGEMVSALVKGGAKVGARDAEGRGALIFGALAGNAVVVELLLDAGAKGDEADKYGDTALMAAAAAGDPSCVDLLIKRGANVNAQNTHHQTALLSGATFEAGFIGLEKGRGHPQVAEDLIHRDEVVKLILDAGADVNARNEKGRTALFSSDDEVVEEVLQHDPDLEVRDDTGGTALVETASESITELLVDAGADVNAEDLQGKTALIQAAEMNYIEKLEILVKAPEIKFDHKDKTGETATMAAKRTGHKECLQALITAEADQ